MNRVLTERVLVVMTTVASGQINPDWDCPQANYMSSSFKTDNLICSFQTLGWIQLARHHSIKVVAQTLLDRQMVLSLELLLLLLPSPVFFVVFIPRVL